MGIKINDPKKLEEIKKINKTVIHGDEMDDFKTQVLALASNKYDKQYMFIIMKDSECLRYIDSLNRNNVLVSPYKVIKHIQEEHPNDYLFLAKLETYLDNSVMALDSMDDNLQNHKQVIALDSDIKQPLVISILQNQNASSIEINKLRTMYDKDNFNRWLVDTYNQFKNIYCNEKTEEFIKSRGVSFPKEMINLLLQNNYNGIINKKQSAIYKDDLETFSKLSKSFSYLDRNYYPIKKFTGKENNFNYMVNGYTTSNSIPIDYNDFYNIANSDYDLFWCLETQQVYIPMTNMLCIWKAPIKNIEEDALSVMEQYKQQYIDIPITKAEESEYKLLNNIFKGKEFEDNKSSFPIETKINDNKENFVNPEATYYKTVAIPSHHLKYKNDKKYLINIKEGKHKGYDVWLPAKYITENNDTLSFNYYDSWFVSYGYYENINGKFAKKDELRLPINDFIDDIETSKSKEVPHPDQLTEDWLVDNLSYEEMGIEDISKKQLEQFDSFKSIEEKVSLVDNCKYILTFSDGYTFNGMNSIPVQTYEDAALYLKVAMYDQSKNSFINNEQKPKQLKDQVREKQEKVNQQEPKKSYVDYFRK